MPGSSSPAPCARGTPTCRCCCSRPRGSTWQAVAELDVAFVGKHSPSLLAEIGNFLRFNLGFGDFVFRLADGREVARARDLRELEERLRTVPEESIVYHADPQPLLALAAGALGVRARRARLRRQRLSDFASVEAAARLPARGAALGPAQQPSGGGRRLRRSAARGQPVLASRSGRAGGKGARARILQSAARRARGQRLRRAAGGAPAHRDRLHRLVRPLPRGRTRLRGFAAASDDDEEIATRFLDAPLPAELDGRAAVPRRAARRARSRCALRACSRTRCTS